MGHITTTLPLLISSHVLSSVPFPMARFNYKCTVLGFDAPPFFGSISKPLQILSPGGQISPVDFKEIVDCNSLLRACVRVCVCVAEGPFYWQSV